MAREAPIGTWIGGGSGGSDPCRLGLRIRDAGQATERGCERRHDHETAVHVVLLAGTGASHRTRRAVTDQADPNPDEIVEAEANANQIDEPISSLDEQASDFDCRARRDFGMYPQA